MSTCVAQSLLNNHHSMQRDTWIFEGRGFTGKLLTVDVGEGGFMMALIPIVNKAPLLWLFTQCLVSLPFAGWQ